MKNLHRILTALALTLVGINSAHATSLMRPGQWTLVNETTVYSNDKKVLVPKTTSTQTWCYTALYLQKADFISEFGLTAPDNGAQLNGQDCQYWSVQFSKSATAATHQIKLYCDKTPRGAMWNVITATAAEKKLDIKMEGRIAENTEAFSETHISFVHKQDACDAGAIKPSDKTARRSTAKLMPQPRVTLLGEDYFLGDIQVTDSGYVTNRYFRLRESKKDFLRDFSATYFADEEKPTSWMDTAEFFYKEKLLPNGTKLLATAKDGSWAISRHIYENAKGNDTPFQVEVVYAHKSPNQENVVLYRVDYEYPASERANMMKPDGLVEKTTAALADALQKLPPVDIFNEAGQRTFTNVGGAGFVFDARHFHLLTSTLEDDFYSNHFVPVTPNGLAQKESIWINHYTMRGAEITTALREQMTPKLTKGAAFEVLRRAANGEPTLVFYVLDSDETGAIEVNFARPHVDGDGSKIVRHAQTIKGSYATHKAAIDAKKAAWADALMAREWRTVTAKKTNAKAGK